MKRNTDIWIEIAHIDQCIEQIKELLKKIEKSNERIKQQALKNCVKIGG